MEPRFKEAERIKSAHEAERVAAGEPKKEPTLSRTHRQALTDFDKLPDAASVPVHVVCALMTLSRSAVWRRTAAGKLPQPVRHGGMTRWQVGPLRKALAGQAE